MDCRDIPSAEPFIKSLVEAHPKNADYRYNLGLLNLEKGSLLEAVNQISKAIEISKHKEVTYYLGLAEAYHLNRDFKQAIYWYKEFLRKSGDKSEERQEVKSKLIKCSNGLQLESSPNVDIQNLGKYINSSRNEIQPKFSYQEPQVIYFSSNVETSIGGVQREKGQEDKDCGRTYFDLYKAVLSSSFTKPEVSPMSYVINGSKHEVLLETSTQEKILFYLQGDTDKEMRIFADTLINPLLVRKEPKLLAERLPELDLQDGLVSQANKCFVFSSSKLGGYGGKDLFIIFYVEGQWTDPINLGNKINTSYDEVSPFLSKEGAYLFYSSDREEGNIGGFDIYYNEYSERLDSWLESKPVSNGINSPSDDLFFSFDQSQNVALFSSNRIGGFGGMDLYRVPFELREGESTRLYEGLKGYPAALAERFFEKSKTPQFSNLPLKISPLFYDIGEEVINPSNIDQLKALSQFLKERPYMYLTIEGHSSGQEEGYYDLFFSMKRAEKVANYIESLGVDKSLISVEALGKNFPIARHKDEVKDKDLPVNRRIEFRLVSYLEGEKEFENVNPRIKPQEYAFEYPEYYSRNQGVTYRVEIKRQNSILKTPLLLQDDYPLISLDRAESNDYIYLVGMFKLRTEAEAFMYDLLLDGWLEAKVVQYADGVKVSSENRTFFQKKYPNFQF